MKRPIARGWRDERTCEIGRAGLGTDGARAHAIELEFGFARLGGSLEA
jgi:hypothetical protein